MAMPYRPTTPEDVVEKVLRRAEVAKVPSPWCSSLAVELTGVN